MANDLHRFLHIVIVCLQVMLGGEWFEELFGSPDTAKEETIKSAALETLQEHLGITQEPSYTVVNIHKVGL